MEIPASLLMSSGTHAYVCVTGCLQADGASVYGLNKEEEEALSKRYPSKDSIINGIMLKCPVMEVLNALAQLGYKVVTTTGTVGEIIWTMQRDL